MPEIADISSLAPSTWWTLNWAGQRYSGRVRVPPSRSRDRGWGLTSVRPYAGTAASEGRPSPEPSRLEAAVQPLSRPTRTVNASTAPDHLLRTAHPVIALSPLRREAIFTERQHRRHKCEHIFKSGPRA
ncbi:hypothetical protein SGLAM104S_01756 [Streptomyces glaucescens]